jgi:hypothetical protein
VNQFVCLHGDAVADRSIDEYPIEIAFGGVSEEFFGFVRAHDAFPEFRIIKIFCHFANLPAVFGVGERFGRKSQPVSFFEHAAIFAGEIKLREVDAHAPRLLRYAFADAREDEAMVIQGVYVRIGEVGDNFLIPR